MKIMHTSDWHIGKKTEKADRLPEQAEVLDEIISVANDEGVELVLVAGDIFDSYVPPSDAEELFYEKVVWLAKNRAVAIIPGNHDDATRLCAAGPLSGRSGVYFAGSINTDVNKSFLSSEREGTNLVGSGEGYMIFGNRKGEKVYVGMLPYPTEARFREFSEGIDYADKITFWMNKCMEGNVDKLPSVLMSHLFTAGGITSDGEREISLGGAKAVAKESFPEVSYVALGHLHKRQVVDSRRNIIYSGSILQYAFDEVNVEKSVTVFDLGADGAVKDLHAVPLRKGKKLARITAASVEDAAKFMNGALDRLTELTLKLKAPLTRDENVYLCNTFPNIISLKLEVEGRETSEKRGRKEMDDETLFSECYARQYGNPPDGELKELYLSLLGEVDG